MARSATHPAADRHATKEGPTLNPQSTDPTAAANAPPINPAIYRPIVACAALIVASAVLFASQPGVDLAASGLFYTKGQGFSLGSTLPVVSIRRLGIATSVITTAAVIIIGIWWRLKPEAMARWPSATPRADWWFVAIGTLVGPILLVNGIFKPVWGRARPVHIEQFGGQDHFTPAWVVAHQCQWNCSFVSGEAAASAFVLAFGVIAPPRWRVPVLGAAIILTLAVSFARMAAGGHFLSDVVTGWLLMALMLLMLHAQIYHGALAGPLKRWLPIRN